MIYFCWIDKISFVHTYHAAWKVYLWHLIASNLLRMLDKDAMN